MARRLAAALLLLGMALFGTLSVSAQDESPELGQEAAKLLIDPASLGDGWSLHHTASPEALYSYGFEMSPDVFREGAAGVYVGPQGSRVLLAALLITENRIAIRKSWEDASNLVDRITFSLDLDYDRQRELESAEPPAGCAEAKRAEGKESGFGLPVGVTMCAIDPDVILIAAAFGAVDEHEGVAASDAVIELILDSTTEQPTATATTPATASTTVTIVAGKPSELQFEPSRVKIPANTDVTVVLRSDGILAHNFTIEELGIRVSVRPGEEAEFTLNADAGTYTFSCTVRGHEEAGMVGTLIAA